MKTINLSDRDIGLLIEGLVMVKQHSETEIDIYDAPPGDISQEERDIWLRIVKENKEKISDIKILYSHLLNL